jgi:hypothetical protein
MMTSSGLPAPALELSSFLFWHPGLVVLLMVESTSSGPMMLLMIGVLLSPVPPWYLAPGRLAASPASESDEETSTANNHLLGFSVSSRGWSLEVGAFDVGKVLPLIGFILGVKDMAVIQETLGLLKFLGLAGASRPHPRDRTR